ncbi:MAG: prepilin peptidase [Planctomycetaceae bacterium]|nr:prepilin peptidase [Planctomycetaceae bacterium]
MFDLHPALLLLVLASGAFTATAAVWDSRFKRIPNKLTIPMFFAGWVYQLGMSVMFGWHHLGSAALGFLVGFGLLFVLWFVGGGGGGDVKLMGALSVWLGFRLTVAVLVVSTLLIILSTAFVLLKSVAFRGVKGMKKQYLGTGKTPVGQKPTAETQDQKIGRRVMTYAAPVAVATWLVLFWYLPVLNKSVGAQEELPATPAAEATTESANKTEDTQPEPQEIEGTASEAIAKEDTE